MIVYVDIDDTICYYEKTNNKLNYTMALPLYDRIKTINEYYDKGHTIIYWTARGTRTGINWFQVTHKQLILWGCKFHELRMNKPAYDLFIDDKNINCNIFFEDPEKYLK